MKKYKENHIRIIIFFIVLLMQESVVNSQKITSARIISNELLADSLYHEGFPKCDTIIKQKHFIRIKCYDSIGDYMGFKDYIPGLFLGYSKLWIYDQDMVAPMLSLYLPYDNYTKHETSDFISVEPWVHTFMFEEGQFIFIIIDKFIDKDNPNLDRYKLILDSIPSEEQFNKFVDIYGRHIPLYEVSAQAFPNDVDFPPRELNPFFDSDTLLRQDRITKAIKRGCCLIILYNVKKNKIKDFEDSAKSLILYEIKKVELDN